MEGRGSRHAADWLQLSGKVALITGGASGLGKACPLELASHGVKCARCRRQHHPCTACRPEQRPAPPARRSVVITDVRPGDVGKEVAEQIAFVTDTRCVFVHCDVSKRAEVTATIDQVAEQFGEIDILVNNGP